MYISPNVPCIFAVVSFELFMDIGFRFLPIRSDGGVSIESMPIADSLLTSLPNSWLVNSNINER